MSFKTQIVESAIKKHVIIQVLSDDDLYINLRCDLNGLLRLSGAITKAAEKLLSSGHLDKSDQRLIDRFLTNGHW